MEKLELWKLSYMKDSIRTVTRCTLPSATKQDYEELLELMIKELHNQFLEAMNFNVGGPLAVFSFEENKGIRKIIRAKLIPSGILADCIGLSDEYTTWLIEKDSEFYGIDSRTNAAHPQIIRKLKKSVLPESSAALLEQECLDQAEYEAIYSMSESIAHTIIQKSSWYMNPEKWKKHKEKMEKAAEKEKKALAEQRKRKKSEAKADSENQRKEKQP